MENKTSCFLKNVICFEIENNNNNNYAFIIVKKEKIIYTQYGLNLFKNITIKKK